MANEKPCNPNTSSAALVLSDGLFGYFAANVGIRVPMAAAPKMHECPEAKIKDLGLWDDVARFEDLDSVILIRLRF
jgi:hypothetical protein